MFPRSALFVFLVFCCTRTDSVLAQVDKAGEQKNDKSTHWLPAAAFEADSGDDDLTRLLKERYRTAAEEVAALEEMGLSGRSQLYLLSEAETRTARAALDLCKTTEQRINVLQKMVDGRKKIEAFFAEWAKAGRDPNNVLYRARYDRLDAEIELVREKRNATQEKK